MASPPYKGRKSNKSEAATQSKLEVEGKEMFVRAKPYLEAALAVDGQDLGTLRSLRDIYARTGEDDKLIDVSGRIKAQQ